MWEGESNEDRGSWRTLGWWGGGTDHRRPKTPGDFGHSGGKKEDPNTRKIFEKFAHDGQN